VYLRPEGVSQISMSAFGLIPPPLHTLPRQQRYPFKRKRLTIRPFSIKARERRD
jgi:hypothetical protein